MRQLTRAFTVIELFAVLGVCLVLAVIVLFAMRPVRTHQSYLKDSTCVRGIMQGMVIWAQSNSDRYPLPGLIDKANDTVPLLPGEIPESKNTSANIMSILVYNGYIPTEMLVSSAEANANIKPYEGYQFSAPPTAAKPDKALWDPAFNADFTGAKPGGLSYAHAYPLATPGTEKIVDRWANTFMATEAILANRGPEVTIVNTSGKTPIAITALATSKTYLIHGPPTSWEGNIGFNDNHVDYVTSFFPELLPYVDAKGAKRPDCLFFDEPDAAQNQNNYLGIFTKAGPQRKDFKGIWD